MIRLFLRLIPIIAGRLHLRGVAPMGRRLELEKYLFARFLLDKQYCTLLYWLLPQI